MTNLSSKSILNCRICNFKLTKVLDLGKQPPANSLRSNKNKLIKPIKLELCRCNNCRTLQLSESVSKKYLFKNYVWVTGTAKTTQVFSKKFCELALKRLKTKSRYILEIASNDGTFLKPFKDKKFKIIGIDPAKNISKIANKNKIKTINEFFNEKSSKKIFKNYGYANLIFARNVIPHVENINQVIKGIANLMDNQTVGCIEFHYVDNIIKQNQYDSVYHEHIFYFSIKSLMNLLKKFSLYCFDVEESPISGGSLIIFFSKSKKNKTKNLIKKINYEKNKKINDTEVHKKFAINSKEHKKKFKKLVFESVKKYKNIYGYGASARSSTLLNFSKISKEIKGIFDKNQIKINKYTAGSNIYIYDLKKFKTLKPDLIIILAWNFANEIIRILKNEYSYKGDYLIPIPEPKIIKNRNKIDIIN